MEDTRKRYKITCPYCGKVQYACKSIAHELGMEQVGYGHCLECRGIMHLIFNYESQSMRAEKWQKEPMERSSV